MKLFLSLIISIFVGFGGLIVIDTGPLRGIAALMLIIPPFLIALLLGNYFTNKQLHKHVK